MPYVGLRSFTETEAAFFFGRDAVVHGLLATWLQRRLVILHGPAGVGKSSLLRAGLLPNLATVDADVVPVGRFDAPGGVPAGGPAAPGPATGLNPYLNALVRWWSGGLPTPTLRRAPNRQPAGPMAAGGSSTLVEVLRAGAGGAGVVGCGSGMARRPILAAVDGFDALLGPGTPMLDPLREQCIQALAAAATALPELHLLLVIRSDALSALAPYERALAADSRSERVPLDPLDRQAAGAALVEPLRSTGRRLGPGVAEACLDDLATSRVVDAAGAETVLTAEAVQPVHLQLLASAMWRSPPPPDRELSPGHAFGDPDELGGPSAPAGLSNLDGPARVGGVDTVLGAYLTTVLLAVAREHDLDEGALRTWLTRTFITERGRRASIDEGLATTAGMPNPLLDALVERYVLACQQRSGARRFELFDDRLIPPLQAAFPAWAHAQAQAPEATAEDFLDAALLHFEDGDLVTASDLATEALRRGATDPTEASGGQSRQLRTQARATQLQAQLDEARGRLHPARQAYRAAAELYETLPDTESSGRALAAVGRLLLQAGHYGRAIEELQAASVRVPGDVEVQDDLARALWYAGQPWAAAAIYSTVLAIAPGTVAALAGRGRLRAELGDNAAALDDFERLARLAPELARDARLRAARALTLAHLGRVDEAARETAAALDAEPDSGEVLWRAGGVERARGRDPEADALLRRSLDARKPALLSHQRERVQQMLRRPGAMA
ncbi:tetratricopeptide repeat protein [Candidatus Frankia nodulisporulans]|uniref:tetratricopeptide repeat protein n=1 Tax=Candidatus Frankia nodulisporulans TaxID=2060052 RepID=UPI0013D2A45A|nr:tetratricopeptide repeat protein [Candidatus Frankia nodulisporulans]